MTDVGAALEVNIVYQDGDLAVVEKPSGLLSVPGRGPDKQDCVVNRILPHFPDMIAQPAVHRLDMQTSGLMVLAKTAAAHRHLSRQFEHRSVKKRYIALVEGMIEATHGEIRLSFRLDPDNRPYQVYDPVHGKPGITFWKRLSIESNRTRVEFKPVTGRTHQLRLHAAHSKGLDTPIVGDSLYGNGKQGECMLLHAAKLKFRHPKDDGPLTFLSRPAF